jgi:hypothetical protein
MPSMVRGSPASGKVGPVANKLSQAVSPTRFDGQVDRFARNESRSETDNQGREAALIFRDVTLLQPRVDQNSPRA